MLRMYTLLETLRKRRDERGATAVEYGLLVALIAIVMIAGVILVGEQLLLLFNEVATELGFVAPTP